MKLLQSQLNFGYQVQSVELSQIKVDETQTVVEASPYWDIFPRQYLMVLMYQNKVEKMMKKLLQYIKK